MHIVVPLAGPDFVSQEGKIKALRSFRGQPLLPYLLQSRPWANQASHHTFILTDAGPVRDFAETYLKQWYPNASIVFLSGYTNGAALSALAGVAMQAARDEPLIVDLGDIYYKSDLDIKQRLSRNSQCGGIALVFGSDQTIYSYLRCNHDGLVVQAAEKRVISDNASAGTYVFRNTSTYLRAMAHALENKESQMHNYLFYVCPLFNGVLAQGMQVEIDPVYDVVDIKKG